MCLFSDVQDTESLSILTEYLTESSQDGKCYLDSLAPWKTQHLFQGGSDLLTLLTLCVSMFLRWIFIVFIHNFSLLGLVIPSLDVLLLFWTSFLMNQVEELNCKLGTIPNLAGAPHWVQRPLTKSCLLSQEPAQFFSFPTSEKGCFKNTVSGMLAIYF